MAEQSCLSPHEQNAATWGVAGLARVALSGTSAVSAQMTVPGVYVATSDVDCYILQGANNVTALTTTSPRLWARTYIRFKVEDATNYGYLAGITDGAGGTLYIWQVK